MSILTRILNRSRAGALLGFLGGMGFMGAMDWQVLGPWVASPAGDAASQGALAPAPVSAAGEAPLLPVFRPLRPAAAATPKAIAGQDASPGGSAPEAAASAPAGFSLPARDIDPTLATVHDDKLVQSLAGGVDLELTLDPFLQEVASRSLRKYQVAYGALVALDPKTGEILALAEYAHDRPELRHMALQAEGPAASLFKLVTASALVDHGQLTPDTPICTHGGERQVALKHLDDHPAADRQCETLAQALGSSNNVAFARWADRVLDPETLERRAEAFLFNRQLPFVWGVAMSRAKLPRGSRLGFARSAAGFEGTTLSPLHAALIAATLANDGVMMSPVLVRRATRGSELLYQAAPQPLAQVLSAETARAVGTMMLTTIRSGTGKKFFERHGKSLVPGLEVASKTGHLTANGAGTDRHYSWFVAFAPAEAPKLAIASLVVNGDVWTVKGVVPARELLSAWWGREHERAAAAPALPRGVEGQ